MEHERLYRSFKDSWIAGVAGGIAEYYKTDPTIIRVLFVLLAIVGGGGFVIYIILWILLPLKEHQSDQDNTEQPVIITEDKINTANAHNNDKRLGSIIAGIILVFLGFLFLLKELIPWLTLERLWPAGLIIVGAIIILSSLIKNKSS